MANRVTDADVKAIIDVDSALTDLTPFITAANLVITAVLGTSTLTEAHLTEIERWLAAHFIAIRDPRVVEEEMGDARTRFAIGGGMQYSNTSRDIIGLSETPYGKQVLLLDTSGLLASSLSKKKASFEVLG